VIEEESVADSDLFQRPSPEKDLPISNDFALNFIEDIVEQVTYEETLILADKISKIKSFLKMIINR
jgi:hypothetical protein